MPNGSIWHLLTASAKNFQRSAPNAAPPLFLRATPFDFSREPNNISTPFFETEDQEYQGRCYAKGLRHLLLPKGTREGDHDNLLRIVRVHLCLATSSGCCVQLAARCSKKVYRTATPPLPDDLPGGRVVSSPPTLLTCAWSLSNIKIHLGQTKLSLRNMYLI